MDRYNVRNLLIVMYLLVPGLFYGLPCIAAYKSGGIQMNFFGSHYLTLKSFIILMLGHVTLGLIVIYVLLRNSFIITIKKTKILNHDLLMIFIFTAIFITNFGILKMLFFPLFIMLYVRRRHYLFTNIMLFTICLILLFFDGLRFPLVQIVLLSSIPILSSLSKTKLLLMSFLSFLIMVFILHPIRHKIIPFSDEINIMNLLFHIQPIFIGADLSMSLNNKVNLLFAETVPFLKSFLGVESVIEIISAKGLNNVAFDSGTRYGSNTSIYFSSYGFIILFSMILLCSFILRFFKHNYFNSAILAYFLVYGIYFIRRSFGSFLIDTSAFIFLFMMFSILADAYRKRPFQSY